MATMSEPIDVWLKFDSDTDEVPTYEANTFITLDSDETDYIVRHYHTDVGQVTELRFSNLGEVYAWYDAQGFQDFTA